MKFEMTKCVACGSEMLTGLAVCPSCGKPQQRNMSVAGPLQPRTLLAVVLAAAVLFAFNWLKPAAPQANDLTARPSASLPSR